MTHPDPKPPFPGLMIIMPCRLFSLSATPCRRRQSRLLPHMCPMAIPQCLVLGSRAPNSPELPWEEEGGCSLPDYPHPQTPPAPAHLWLPWAPQTLNNLFPLLLLPHDKAPGMQ